jgi:DNA-binding transcriptional regulator YiaG
MDAKTVRRIRKGLKLTQAGLAARLGVHRLTVSKWERGQHPVPPMAERLLKQLAQLTDS